MQRLGSPIFAALALAALPAFARGASAEKADFNRDVLPILAANCFECHGPDAAARKAKLRLDLREVAVAQREGVTAIVPGKPQQSELISRVSSDDAEQVMPPAKKGPRLTPQQIGLLRDWIEQGAEYAEHWAFIPPKRT